MAKRICLTHSAYEVGEKGYCDEGDLRTCRFHHRRVPTAATAPSPTPNLIPQKVLRDGEPCDHRGCLNHVTHPCEGCGRIGGRASPPPEATTTTDAKEIDGLVRDARAHVQLRGTNTPKLTERLADAICDLQSELARLTQELAEARQNHEWIVAVNKAALDRHEELAIENRSLRSRLDAAERAREFEHAWGAKVSIALDEAQRECARLTSERDDARQMFESAEHNRAVLASRCARLTSENEALKSGKVRPEILGAELGWGVENVGWFDSLTAALSALASHPTLRVRRIQKDSGDADSGSDSRSDDARPVATGDADAAESTP